MDSDHTPSDAVCILHELDTGDDGSMNDVEEDQEAFYAVFPQAPNLAKHHALRPFVDALRVLLARPQHLFAALVADPQLVAQDPNALERKVRAYTQKHLKEALTADQWHRATDFLKRRSSHGDRWPSPQLVQQVDEMMLKFTLYYAHLWTYSCSGAVRCVYQVDSAVSQLHAQWTAKMPLPPTVSAATPQSRSTKLPALEETSMYRPLRLRSHTAAAARAATDTSSTTEAAAAASDSDPGKTPTDASNAAAYRRARLARTSNEFLIAWFLHHKAKPYPSQTERAQIAKKTGLTEQQVRNWFANMRKRHWKPKAGAKTKKPRCLLDTLLRKSEPTNA